MAFFRGMIDGTVEDSLQMNYLERRMASCTCSCLRGGEDGPPRNMRMYLSL